MWATRGCLVRSMAASIRPYNPALSNAVRGCLNGMKLDGEVENEGKIVAILPSAKVYPIPPELPGKSTHLKKWPPLSDMVAGEENSRCLECQGKQAEEVINSSDPSPSASAEITNGIYRPNFLNRPTRKITRSWTSVGAAWTKEDVNRSEAEELKSKLANQMGLVAELEKELQVMRMNKTQPPNTGDKKINATKDQNDQDSLESLKEELKVTLVDPDTLGRQTAFNDVVGHAKTKQVLLEALIWPASAHPSIFTGIRGRSNGVLMYGPPGCGKTMLARAAAVELKGIASFFLIRPGDIMARFYGESQQRVQALEKLVRESAPAVVFFDEVDSLLGNRDGSQVSEYHRATTNALLAWMDGFSVGDERIFFIAATNRPGSLDEAALRRFDEVVEVGTPSFEMRVQLVTKLIEAAGCQGHRMNLKASEIEHISKAMDGFSLADVDRVVRKSYFLVLRELPTGTIRHATAADVPPVTVEHFQEILKELKGTAQLHKHLQKRDNVMQ